MTPWQVIEEALAHKKPPRSAQWLADQLHVKIQVVSNWKARGVPPGRYREIASALDLSVDQIEGVEPLPWEKVAEWPFDDRGLFDRVKSLRPEQRLELQGVLRRMVLEFEQELTRSFTSGAVEAAQRTSNSPVLHEPPVGYPVSQQERGAGAKRYPALEEAARYAEDGNGSTQHQPASRRKGGGRA